MKLQTTYPSNNYPIYVEHGAIDHISTYIDQFDQSFILIDEHVNQYFADKFDDILSYENVHKVIIPAGERPTHLRISRNIRVYFIPSCNS